MTKKIGLVIIAVLVVFVIFAMGMRRSHMMGGAGSDLELTAVSVDGAAILLSPDVEAVTGKLEKNTAAQKSGDMIVSLALSPYPPSAGQPATFDVKLTDVNGKAIDDASISLDLTMPSMWMPPNQLTMEFVTGGKYTATGQFSMHGGWRIEVIITRGDKTQSVFFDVGM
jgi:hypothetical protein